MTTTNENQKIRKEKEVESEGERRRRWGEGFVLDDFVCTLSLSDLLSALP
jgi:hypothetical protein